jgi:hypothetical protein
MGAYPSAAAFGVFMLEYLPTHERNGDALK